jgi:tRNA pseudouridine65 synthase
MRNAVNTSDDFIIDALDRPLAILYQDEHYVAVFKPAGLVVHRSKLTLPDEPVLMQTLRDQLDRFIYPVHRIDRPTAGVVLFGLSSEAARRMVQMFTDRQITKHYQALVRGHTEAAFTIDRPLGERLGDGWDRGTEQSGELQPATTHFRCLEQYELPWEMSGFPTSRFSLLEINPITGRWHQIRRHLNQAAKPVIGDHRHGDHRYNQRVFAETGIYRMLLTAMRLDFRHPFTNEPTTILSSWGQDFDRVIEQLRRDSRSLALAEQ